MTKEVITSIHKKEEGISLKAKILFSISLFLFLGSLFAQIFVTNDVAVKGKQIVTLSAERTVLEKEISVMKLESSKLSSLSVIAQKASQLGFYPNDTYANLIDGTVNTASLSTL